jgi:hypothetical protein
MNETTTKSKATESKAPAGAETEVIAMPVPFRPLQVNRLKLIRSSESDLGNLHAAVLPAGTPFEHALRPEVFGLVAHRLRIGDQIEVHVDDQTFFGRLLVRDVSGQGQVKTRASCARLELHHFDKVETDTAALTHQVRHAGPHLKWSIYRLADGKLIKDGFEERADAEKALASITRVPVKSREPAA